MSLAFGPEPFIDVSTVSRNTSQTSLTRWSYELRYCAVCITEGLVWGHLTVYSLRPEASDERRSNALPPPDGYLYVCSSGGIALPGRGVACFATLPVPTPEPALARAPASFAAIS